MSEYSDVIVSEWRHADWLTVYGSRSCPRCWTPWSSSHGDWSPAGKRADVMPDASLENRPRPSVLPLPWGDTNRHASFSIKLSRTRFTTEDFGHKSVRASFNAFSKCPPQKPERVKQMEFSLIQLGWKNVRGVFTRRKQRRGWKLTTQMSDIFTPQEDFQRTCVKTAEGTSTATNKLKKMNN